MSRRVLLPLAATALALPLAACGSAGGDVAVMAPAAVTVPIEGFAYRPATVTVARGARVTWIDRDRASHTVTGTGWDLGNLDRGGRRSHTFTASGTYAYLCEYHPFMRGRVVVR